MSTSTKKKSPAKPKAAAKPKAVEAETPAPIDFGNAQGPHFTVEEGQEQIVALDASTNESAFQLGVAEAEVEADAHLAAKAEKRTQAEAEAAELEKARAAEAETAGAAQAQAEAEAAELESLQEQIAAGNDPRPKADGPIGAEAPPSGLFAGA